MNKKGFVFVETIVTLTILMALLITLYGGFVNVLQKERTVAEYDKNGDIYAMFYIKEIWKKAKTSSNTRYIEDNDDYADSYLIYDIAGHPERHPKLNLFDIKYIVVGKCNSGSRTFSFQNKYGSQPAYSPLATTPASYYSKEFIDYIKSISTCPSSSKYVLYGEFRHGDGPYTYAHVYYPYYEQD